MKSLKTSKQCKLGAQCGSTCISKDNNCKVNLTGAQKTSVKKAVEKTREPVKFLGAGAFGEVHLNSDGSVTKTYKDQDLSYQVNAAAIKREATFQAAAAKVGIAPKVLSYDKESITMEKAEGKVGDFNTKFSHGGALRTALTKLHKIGIAHNDPHGGNTFFDDKTKKLTLIDFGVSTKDLSDIYYEYYNHVRKDNKLDSQIFDGETYMTWLKTQ